MTKTEVGAPEVVVLADRAELARATQAYRNDQLIGFGSGPAATVRCLHVPLATGPIVRGVLVLESPELAASREPERLQLLRALASQTALALERCLLADDAQHARALADAERTRNALLSSVSHDLRTPLAAITGAASSLRDDAGVLSGATRRDLAETISEEAQRLNRLIGSLLDMTRLEAGAVAVQTDWHSVEELVGAALARLEPQLGSRGVRLDLAAGLPLVPLDGLLFEQLVGNLLENALKHGAVETPIEIVAEIDGTALRFEVAARGPGLDPEDLEAVFQKFHRGRRAAGRPGAGLGLAICRAIAVAHGGTIEAANRPGGGASFVVRLPLGGEPPAVEAEPGTAR